MMPHADQHLDLAMLYANAGVRMHAHACAGVLPRRPRCLDREAASLHAAGSSAVDCRLVDILSTFHSELHSISCLQDGQTVASESCSRVASERAVTESNTAIIESADLLSKKGQGDARRRPRAMSSAEVNGCFRNELQTRANHGREWRARAQPCCRQVQQGARIRPPLPLWDPSYLHGAIS